MTEHIKSLIDNSKEPLVFHNLLKWNLLDWDLDKWNECMGNTNLQFRLGYKANTLEPQWERTCEKVKGTFEDFRNFKEPDQWLYFDYKYLDEWFVDKFDLRNEISWDAFGYPDIKAKDSTIWIGSEGAHTPCHVDTYGFNLIAQLTGRKQWLLFPPNTDFHATRIPYEESTIYSSINFYSPSSISMATLQDSSIRCKKVILEPGQVLFVPNGWWHYVENLELAISINTWVPIPQDNDKRISEAITLMIVKSLTNGLKSEELETIVNNTNELQSISTTETLKLIETSLVTSSAPASPTSDNKVSANNLLNTTNINNSEWVKEIPDLSNQEFVEFMKLQLNRFSQNNALEESNSSNSNKNNPNTLLMRKYLSILTDSDVIELVKQKIVNFKDKFDEINNAISGDI